MLVPNGYVLFRSRSVLLRTVACSLYRTRGVSTTYATGGAPIARFDETRGTKPCHSQVCTDFQTAEGRPSNEIWSLVNV